MQKINKDNEILLSIFEYWSIFQDKATYSSFANLLGISRQTLYLWLNKNKTINSIYKFKICNTFHIKQEIWNKDISKEKRDLFFEKSNFHSSFKSKEKNNYLNNCLGEWHSYFYANSKLFLRKNKEINKNILKITFNDKNGYIASFENKKEDVILKYEGKITLQGRELSILLKGQNFSEILHLVFLKKTYIKQKMIGVYSGLDITSGYPICGLFLLSRKEIKDMDIRKVLGERSKTIIVDQDYECELDRVSIKYNG